MKIYYNAQTNNLWIPYDLEVNETLYLLGYGYVWHYIGTL